MATCFLVGYHRPFERLRNPVRGRPADVRELFEISPSTRLVGQAYLENSPEERDPVRLLDLLVSAESGYRDDFEKGDSVHRRRIVQACIRGDYTDGRVVRVRGWVLSRTEARLYAFLTVTGGGVWSEDEITTAESGRKRV